jgi:dTDP-4-dehydrorhamnose reductase
MILITGASGLLGATITLRALELQKSVLGVSRHNPLDIPCVRCLDLTDFEGTRRLVLNLRPSAIIHCAATTDVDYSENHPDEVHENNVRVSALLAQLAAESNARYMQISTDSVFDGRDGLYSENDSPRPLNVYARTKLLAEQEATRAHPRPLIVRVNFYGWNLHGGKGLAQWILEELSQGKTLKGFTDVFFCPLLVNDLAEILLTMQDLDLAGIYHVVGSERISKYDFATRLATTFGFDPCQIVPSSIADANLRAVRPQDTSLRTEKISLALCRPMPDVGSGIQKFCDLDEGNRFRRLQSCEVGVNR